MTKKYFINHQIKSVLGIFVAICGLLLVLVLGYFIATKAGFFDNKIRDREIPNITGKADSTSASHNGQTLVNIEIHDMWSKGIGAAIIEISCDTCNTGEVTTFATNANGKISIDVSRYVEKGTTRFYLEIYKRSLTYRQTNATLDVVPQHINQKSYMLECFVKDGRCAPPKLYKL